MWYRIEYKLPGSDKWHREPLQMKDRAALERQAKKFAEKEHWTEYRIIQC